MEQSNREMAERSRREASKTLLRVRLEREQRQAVSIVTRDERGQLVAYRDVEAPRAVVKSAMLRLGWILGQIAIREKRAA